ncbi:MAG: HAMP domain-containing sensor histidine kinase [Acidobacteria bacterium]|nr:HAMP domain-containing sensor histidine kinase [Acidobacteriota bacterium]
MLLPDRSAPVSPFPWGRFARIAAAGVGCALAMLLLGSLAERLAFGPDDASAHARTEGEVRSSFDEMARALRLMAAGMADADVVVAAAQDDVTAASRLFVAATAAIAQGNADFAVTAYDANGEPVAWDGRPSELPRERVLGDEAWFFTQGALGLRLVYVTPVIAADGRRVGAVAAERSIGLSAASEGGNGADPFRYSSPTASIVIDLSFEAGRTVPDPAAFEVLDPSGARLFTASVDALDLERTRDRWQRASRSGALLALALALVWLCAALLDWRNTRSTSASYCASVALVAMAVAVIRLLLGLAQPAEWLDVPTFSGSEYSSSLLNPLLTSPFDFLATALAVGALVALLLYACESWRLRYRQRRARVDSVRSLISFAARQLAAGAGVAAIVWGHQRLVGDTVANATLDLLHFSLHPWSASRLALQVGLLVFHASALGGGVLLLRAALVSWIVPRRATGLRIGTVGLWLLPLVLVQLVVGAPTVWIPMLVSVAVMAALADSATRLAARYRHGSQAYRLTLLALGLVVPAVAFYPSVFQIGREAKSQLVETRYAPQAVTQRQTIQLLLQDALAQIDQFPGLSELATTPPLSADGESSTDRAYQVWRLTDLAEYPVTSSVELHGIDGLLVSRFAFNLPDDLTAVPRSDEQSCDWGVYEEVSPFFAEDRRILHAGRAICDDDGQPAGSVVVHAILDYANLPFIQSQNPYVELMRPMNPMRGEGIAGRDVEFAFYGWSRTPLYASGPTAWTLDDAVFAQVEQARAPIWTRLQRGDTHYDAYLLNDRGGIYALGFPVASPLAHFVNLAELTMLAWGTYLALLAATAGFAWVTRRGTTGRALLREIRASFYRKLLLAFIAATVVPVAALAVATRTYVADVMRANVEQEAIRTAGAARRVVEDFVAPRAAQQGANVDDNLMVWVSRLIDQDVNLFSGAHLLATSERNLFASGLLPTRTPADVYRALDLRNEATTVVREEIGALSYLVAGTAVATQQLDAVLTVPLTSRELEIEAQIDALDRQVLLGALCFMFGGAAIGYWLAERIADPVNRLTRATRRLARGDLDVRIAATSSDELQRLVQDFNRMAGELQHQRRELERTHRLEAWAEMARQVAHEIKNPLTPIQLNAEHLRRVHADRGEPLSPVLEECIGTILTQVTLLRQIASEFSSFASSPAVLPVTVELPALLHEAIDPYRAPLDGRIRFDLDVPGRLPPVHVDRILLLRSLTNIVENALHAMPGPGVLTVRAWSEASRVCLRVSDTGMGMDAEALARVFEPYFSTKTSGTGLGLPIAKRNIELNKGTIAVTSVRDRGTTVEITLPVAAGQTAGLQT